MIYSNFAVCNGVFVHKKKNIHRTKDLKIKSNPDIVWHTWHVMWNVWYWFCRQVHGRLVLSSAWCMARVLRTWQAVPGQIALPPISSAMFPLQFAGTGWLIDQLSCSLLNRGAVCCDWYRDYSKTSLCTPRLSSSSKSYLCVLKAVSGFH